jgi:hypothetical protein
LLVVSQLELVSLKKEAQYASSAAQAIFDK